MEMVAARLEESLFGDVCCLVHLVGQSVIRGYECAQLTLSSCVELTEQLHIRDGQIWFV